VSNSGPARQVVILDRDGTIVVDRHYLGDPSELQFAPGAEAGLRQLHAMGCRLVVITNQSGVGRGLLSLDQVERVNNGLREMVARIGAKLEAIYFCPHAPDAGCMCRKPESELLIQAGRELEFEPSSVVVVGDKESDVEFGRRVGAMSILVALRCDRSMLGVKPDFVVSGLDEVAGLIEARTLRR
jgi:D-glycero-D-manno-heptose 1,7-bisphosphate phosphatase